MALMAVALLVLRLSTPAPHPRPAGPMTPSRTEASSTPVRTAGDATGFGARVGFHSPERLREHFEKHGAEFGAADPAEYLLHAQALRDAALGGDVLQAVRADGVVSRFDRASGTFVAFDRDGTIRTCFKPNDGERYFVRQANRRSR